MSSQIDKYINGSCTDAYLYLGAFKVSNGVCFRLYAPHAKEVEVISLDRVFKMEKVDFRGVFEVRASGVKEFDPYFFRILTSDNIWIKKDDPYAKYVHDKNVVFIDTDEYSFDDDKWVNKKKNENVFNACYIDKE